MRRTSLTTAEEMIASVEALPEADRLEAAYDAVRWAMGFDNWIQAELRELLGTTPQVTRLCELLLRSRGRPVSRERFAVTIWGQHAEQQSKAIDVYLVKIRTALSALTGIPRKSIVRTLWGEGWALDPAVVEHVDRHHPDLSSRLRGIPDERSPFGPIFGARRTPWTEEQDADLRLMLENGSDWWAIAEEVGRTERGCRDRAQALGLGTGNRGGGQFEPWTEDEDRKLLILQDAIGDLASVALHFERTERAVAERFVRLTAERPLPAPGPPPSARKPPRRRYVTAEKAPPPGPPMTEFENVVRRRNDARILEWLTEACKECNDGDEAEARPAVETTETGEPAIRPARRGRRRTAGA